MHGATFFYRVSYLIEAVFLILNMDLSCSIFVNYCLFFQGCFCCHLDSYSWLLGMDMLTPEKRPISKSPLCLEKITKTNEVGLPNRVWTGLLMLMTWYY
jgi:hypothetical protein